MEKGLNFRTLKGREEYHFAYEQTLRLWDVDHTRRTLSTSFGQSHCICCGCADNPPLLLLHAASCGSTIWYSNVKALSQRFAVYAIDLITEASESVLLSPIKNPTQCAAWLDETVAALGLARFYICGLSIGGWTAVHYALRYPQKVAKLVLLSPIQTFSGMYLSFFIKIMQMGFRPTRHSVEAYLGWGGAQEAPLPDSVIEQFTISALNINSNGVFPKPIPKKRLRGLTMPMLVLFGEHEFSFDIHKASDAARKALKDVTIELVANASHLLCVSAPDHVNTSLCGFLSNP